jgi:hypothetical protein
MNGAGIIKGMIETARNFAGSYYDPARLTTVQYPEEKLAAKENARTIFPFLVFDGDDRDAGTALHRLHDLREGMPAAVHLHRQRHGQETGLRGQDANAAEGVRHRYFRLHELRNLRGGLPV